MNSNEKIPGDNRRELLPQISLPLNSWKFFWNQFCTNLKQPMARPGDGGAYTIDTLRALVSQRWASFLEGPLRDGKTVDDLFNQFVDYLINSGYLTTEFYRLNKKIQDGKEKSDIQGFVPSTANVSPQEVRVKTAPILASPNPVPVITQATLPPPPSIAPASFDKKVEQKVETGVGHFGNIMYWMNIWNLVMIHQPQAKLGPLNQEGFNDPDRFFVAELRKRVKANTGLFFKDDVDRSRIDEYFNDFEIKIKIPPPPQKVTEQKDTPEVKIPIKPIKETRFGLAEEGEVEIDFNIEKLRERSKNFLEYMESVGRGEQKITISSRQSYTSFMERLRKFQEVEIDESYNRKDKNGNPDPNISGLRSGVLAVIDLFDHTRADQRDDSWSQERDGRDVERLLDLLAASVGIRDMKKKSGDEFLAATNEYVSKDNSNEIPPGHILKVISRGFVDKDEKLIRPAQVSLSIGPSR